MVLPSASLPSLTFKPQEAYMKTYEATYNSNSTIYLHFKKSPKNRIIRFHAKKITGMLMLL